MDRDRILGVIKRTFNIPEPVEEIGLKVVRQDTIENWDSLGHLQLCMALEQEFGVKFEMKEMPTLTTLEKIEECLSEKMST